MYPTRIIRIHRDDIDGTRNSQVIVKNLTSKQLYPGSSKPCVAQVLCGRFSESKEKNLRINDVDLGAFVKTLDIWSGRADAQEMELHEVQELASVADRFQITEVISALEEAVMG